jgi:predicted transcriptional regulator of viral defense system
MRSGWPEEDGWSCDSPRVHRLRAASTFASIGREVSVLACFTTGQGLTSQEIAVRLDLSPDTVEDIASNLVSLHYLERVAPGAYMLAKDPR